jgi:arylsulfatase A-like enzyme
MWFAALLAGCSGSSGPTAADPVGPPAPIVAPAPPVVPEGVDVVFVVLDTLRADALTQYGAARPTSPNLSDFVRTATRFDAAYAPAPWTVPSTATILTGLHPLRHGMRHVGDVMPATIETLAERLAGAGWRTAAYSHNTNVSKKTGYDQGFQSFTSTDGDIFAYPNAGVLRKEVGAWFTQVGAARSFLYLQPMNCHGPYRVPKSRSATLLGRSPSRAFAYYQGPMRAILRKGDLSARAQVNARYTASLREQYDTAVRYATDEVGKLFADLEARGRYDNALIVLTADHGEELFDHGGFSHGYSLHDELLHVPLWVKLPGQRRASIVGDTVSLADLVPTVLDALAVPIVAPPGAPPPLDGRSLTPLLRGEPLPARPLLFDVDWKRRAVAQGVQDGAWKLIDIRQNYEGLSDVTRLYDHAADPDEQHDLSEAQPAKVAELQVLLTTLAKAATGEEKGALQNVLSEMDQAQLEALGYLE